METRVNHKELVITRTFDAPRVSMESVDGPYAV